MQKIGIVVPCYNESKRLDINLFEDFIKSHKECFLCFVNDASKDNTAEILSDLSVRNMENVSVITNAANKGKAESVRIGVNELLKIENLEFIGYLDADLAAPIETVIVMAEKLQTNPGLQMLMASRVRMLGYDIIRRRIRHYLGRVYASIVSLILKADVYDTQCGAKLFRNKYLGSVFGERFITNWGFDAEIIMRFKQISAYRIEDIVNEYPIEVWRDVKGSKVGFSGTVSMSCDLIKLFILSLKMKGNNR